MRYDDLTWGRVSIAAGSGCLGRQVRCYRGRDWAWEEQDLRYATLPCVLIDFYYSILNNRSRHCLPQIHSQQDQYYPVISLVYGIMSWESIQQSTRNKIQNFLGAFSSFVEENHSGEAAEDELVRQEWEKFREFIEGQPGDTQKHNKYVLDLRKELLKRDILSAKEAENQERQKQRQMSRPKIVVDKPRLQTISKELKRMVLRNTQTPLNLLQ